MIDHDLRTEATAEIDLFCSARHGDDAGARRQAELDGG
jgi:hypothetical protein